MTDSLPLTFVPFLRPQIWGGRRLLELFGKPLPDGGTYGESWEISAHPLHVSRVADGPSAGMSLVDVWMRRSPDPFPLLVKILDCKELLSIQVHPTDELAHRLSGESRGKTEAWVVLDVQPTGRIYAGFRPGTTRQEVEERLRAGTLAECLHAIAPRVGDCVFLPAGIVHAVGGGVVLAEIQQTSDTTYRLFDWNRVGADGKPRTLHIAEALEAIDWQASPVVPSMPRPLGDGVEELLRCPYFTLERHTGGKKTRTPVAHQGEMSLWIVVEGAVELSGPSGFRKTLGCGSTVLIPEDCRDLTWTPHSESCTVVCVRR